MIQITEERLREIVEQAHMAGQHDSSHVDPSYYEAMRYYDVTVKRVFENNNIKTPEETINDGNKRIIAEQDRKISELIRKVDHLEDAAYRREQWLDKAKKDAGYDRGFSFDTVWADTLKHAKMLKEKYRHFLDAEDLNLL